MIRKAAPALIALILAATAAGATTFTVTSSIVDGQTLTGKLRWTATTSTTAISTVEFFVDGSLKTTEKKTPYVYGGDQGVLDTTALSNGPHVFAVTPTATDGSKQSVTGTATTKNPPVNTSLPSSSGIAREGSTLAATRGGWSGPGPIGYAYSWLRCDSAGNNCATISGASSSSYRVSAADVGHRLRVVVNASNSAGAAAATSAATGVVAARGNAPTLAAEPGISGTPRDGSILSASNGSWHNSPTSFRYQWLRCDSNAANCGAIGGANARRYTIVTADVGRRLRVTVTASNSFGSASANSNATATVQATGAAPANTSLPWIFGATKEGSKLDANNGTWSGTQPFTFSYAWRRCDSVGNACVDISGASAVSYVAATADVGHTLRVAVTTRNAKGAAAALSPPTGLISPAKPGAQTIDVAQVALPNTLVIDGARFSPNPLRSRLAPIVARFHVSDTRGFSVAGAEVLALGLPYGWVRNAPEALTDGAGWATVVLRAGATLPKRGALVVFVRARKPGESVLSAVTARRLVQTSIRR